MLSRLIDSSLRHRAVVIGVYLALAACGIWALFTTPIDAIPDLSDNQVIVFSEWAGHSAQEVEDQVTYPVTSRLRGLAGVRVVRGQSAFGFSMIYVVFQDDVDLYFARTRVLERLNLIAGQLPAGVTPALGPDATGVGHVFWYTVERDGASLQDLRTLQDWVVRPQLSSVPGVAEIASVGGTVRQYQIDVDPNRLRAVGVGLGEVVRAVQQSNANVGGNVLEANGTWTVVRGVGLIRTVDDLGDTPIKAVNGVPVLVKQVADVHIGDAFRVASLVKGTAEAVGGVVVARAGTNTREVIDGVKARLTSVEASLPPGTHIRPFYDRSTLIEQTIGTLRVALIEEILLVTLAHVIFLWHVRSILVVTLPLPMAVLLSFLAMRLGGVTANIMSLAGLAIAIGVLVDAAIVVTENAMRRLSEAEPDRLTPAGRLELIRSAASQVGRPVWFSMAIIVVTFGPVFALTGQEGKLFHPLAFAKTAAIAASAVIALTLVPVLGTLFLRGRIHTEESHGVMRAARRVYRPVLTFALGHRWTVMTIAAVLFAGAALAAPQLGSEFMPPLFEGDLMFMPIADPSISLAENTDLAKRQNAALLAFPEVESVVAKVARADTSTDPAPLNMTETLVHLKPQSQWPAGVTVDSLRGDMSRAVQLPGVSTIWTMPIVNRIDMLTTGIRSELGVKILGSDLSVLERLAEEVARVLRTVPGSANVYAESVVAGQYLNVSVDRLAAARQGLTVGAVEDVISYGIGETPVGTTIEGRERFPIRVRYAPAFRSAAGDIGNVLVTGPNGQQIPLKAVATIQQARGPAMVSSEDGLLLTTVLLNVTDHDIGGFVARATDALQELPLPTGYTLRWSGQFEQQIHATQSLRWIAPLAILLIFGLLWWTYRSTLEALHVLLAVPFALTGGVHLVWLLHYRISVAVWVGFIALFGTAVQTVVVMVMYLHEAVDDRQRAAGRALTRGELRDAVVAGALLRLRPKLMTVSTVVAGLLPIMWSRQIGADVMKPLAAPVLGGMASSLAHVLIVTPVLFYAVHARGLARDAAPQRRARASRWIVAGTFLVGAAVVWTLRGPRAEVSLPEASTIVHQEVVDGTLVLVTAPDGRLHLGSNVMTVEFRSASTRALVDVTDVHFAVGMGMPGMAMPASIGLRASPRPGQQVATAEFGMAGAWRVTVTWQQSGGSHTLSFEGVVQ